MCCRCGCRWAGPIQRHRLESAADSCSRETYEITPQHAHDRPFRWLILGREDAHRIAKVRDFGSSLYGYRSRERGSIPG